MVSIMGGQLKPHLAVRVDDGGVVVVRLGEKPNVLNECKCGSKRIESKLPNKLLVFFFPHATKLIQVFVFCSPT